MSKTATIAALLKEATAVQRVRVRAHLERQEGRGDNAIALSALRAFDARKYSDESIAR